MIERIVVLNDLSKPQGGASLLAVQSARAFVDRGYATTMITGDVAPTDASDGVDYVSLGHDRLLGRNLANSMLRGVYNGAARKLVEDWIERNDTPGTVYHIHGWSQILSPALFAALAKVRARTVMTAHDFFLTCPNGAIYDYVAERPCGRRPMSSSCISARCDRRNHAHKLWRVTRQAMQARMLGKEDMPPQLLIHAGMKAYFERSGLTDRDMVVLPNPVTPYTARRVRAEANRDVLFVGRMESTKGIELAAEACRKAGARLVAVGDGSLLDRLRTEYPEMSFVGRLPRARIAEVAAQARMLVMPSRHMEPFGLTAVEALWSGLPVLTSGHALIAEDIERTGAGMSIDPRKRDDFAALIQRLLDDDELTEKMSVAAFEQTAHLALDPETWTDALLAAYRALLAGGREELQRVSQTWSGSRVSASAPDTLLGATA